MAVFPTLSVDPIISAWEEQISQDPTLRHETDGGYVITGTTFTGTPPNKYHVKLEPATAADKAAVKALEVEVHVGAGMFDWTDPDSAETLDVRFMGPVKYRRYTKQPDKWTVEFDIEEV